MNARVQNGLISYFDRLAYTSPEKTINIYAK